MKTRKFLTLIIILAFISTAIIVWRFLIGTGDNPSQISAKQFRADVVKEDKNQPAALQRDFIYPANNLRDPFQRPKAKILAKSETTPSREVYLSTVTLTGIIWNPEKPIAIIADSENKSHLVKTGDAIGRTKVIDIHQRSIVIEMDGKRQELLLWPEKQ